MNPEIKKEWIEALTSGEFKQGREYLCVNDNYCCLGVLSEIAVRHGIIDKAHDRSSYSPIQVYDNGYTATLSPKIQVWSGINDSIGQAPNIKVNKEKYTSLVDLNDSNVPFSEIAKVIEEIF